MLATYSFRRKQDFRGAIQRKSLSLVEKIRVLTKSCKNPRLFDLYSGLTIGLLELFLDHQKQNFKQNSKVPKSAQTKNAQKTVPLTERLTVLLKDGPQKSYTHRKRLGSIANHLFLPQKFSSFIFSWILKPQSQQFFQSVK